MYEAHFGLHTNPFSPTPTPEFIYESAEYREALAHFRFALENREPFLLLSGEVGTGKTTAIQALRRQLPGRASVAVVNYTTLDPRELLEEIVRRFGLDVASGESKPSLMHRLERFLLDRRRGGDPSLLVLDEAHLLTTPLLEEVRLLSNMEDEGGKLLQICLVGQPELDAHLQSPELRQIRQRISVRYALRPLTQVETRDYIHHRLHAAGATDPEGIFPDDPCSAVFQITQGIPREVNVLAGQALLNAFLEDAEQVRRAHVISARLDYGFEGLGSPPRSVLEEKMEKMRSTRRPATPPPRSRPIEPPPRSRTVEPRPSMPPAPAPVEPAPRIVEEASDRPRAVAGGRPLPRPIPLPPPSLRPVPRPAEPKLQAQTTPEPPAEPPTIKLSKGPGTFQEDKAAQGPRVKWMAMVVLVVGILVAGVLVLPKFQGTKPDEEEEVLSVDRKVPSTMSPTADAREAESGGGAPEGKAASQSAVEPSPAAADLSPATAEPSPAPVSEGELPPEPEPPSYVFEAPRSGLIGIQVASFRELSRAEVLVSEIVEKTGLEGSIHGSLEGGNQWYRVFAGAFPSREEAKVGALILRENGIIDEAIFRPIPGSSLRSSADSAMDAN